MDMQQGVSQSLQSQQGFDSIEPVRESFWLKAHDMPHTPHTSHTVPPYMSAMHAPTGRKRPAKNAADTRFCALTMPRRHAVKLSIHEASIPRDESAIGCRKPSVDISCLFKTVFEREKGVRGQHAILGALARSARSDFYSFNAAGLTRPNTDRRRALDHNNGV